ncbi:MAG: hypothetical protein SFY67_05690 [Candidatus Melainabacteria bacterium]|jgi:hypothetical protein|nr:hypothetical protein [Candidatus Melainabacteria bacterium]
MKRHQKIMSLVTIFGLLMFVSASWFNQPVSGAVTSLAGVEHNELSFVSSTYPTYLAEVKTKTPYVGACDLSFKDAGSALGPRKSIDSLLSQSGMSACNPCSLWLLHRSLLI